MAATQCKVMDTLEEKEPVWFECMKKSMNNVDSRFPHSDPFTVKCNDIDWKCNMSTEFDLEVHATVDVLQNRMRAMQGSKAIVQNMRHRVKRISTTQCQNILSLLELTTVDEEQQAYSTFFLLFF